MLCGDVRDVCVLRVQVYARVNVNKTISSVELLQNKTDRHITVLRGSWASRLSGI